MATIPARDLVPGHTALLGGRFETVTRTEPAGPNQLHVYVNDPVWFFSPIEVAPDALVELAPIDHND